MLVVVVGQSKGGVGKTTLAINAAEDISRNGRSVTLIDADPQAGATLWSEPQKLSFPVRPESYADRGQLLWVRNVLKSTTDFVVVDLPAGFGPLFETAVMIADLLVIPCGPSSLDIAGAEKTLRTAREIRRSEVGGPRLKVVLVPTRVDVSTEEGAQIEEVLADLGEPVGPALSADPEFVRSFASGETVLSRSQAANAALDVRRLSVFLLRQVLPAGKRIPPTPG